MEYIEKETANVREAFLEVSKELGFPQKFIDFDIEDESTLEDDKGNVVKIYSLKFYINEEKSDLYEIMSIDVNNPENPQKAYIVVDTSKLDKPKDVSEDEILDVMKKILALEGIKYGIKDKMLPAIAKEIKRRLDPSFKPFRILVAEGRKPVRGKNSELKFFFNKYHAAGSITKDGKIDYKKKNFLVPVNKGKVLIEFNKPTRGKEGYDVYGRVVPQDVGVIIEDIDSIKFNPESIERVEEDRIIRLIAKKDGVIIFKDGMYDIDTSVSVDKVDIRTTGNLDADKSVDLEIGRSGNNSVEDTIAAGMKVKGKKVVVNGDVGPKAVIEAEEVDIKGSVHQDAKVIAKKVKIAICRGTVEAEEVDIDLAEHAKIISKKSATIKKAIASKLFCPKIEITDTMMSSNITTSSESVVINNVEGDDNLIAIQPLNLPWIKEKYNELGVKREYAKVLVNTYKKKYQEALSSFEKEKRKYDDVAGAIQDLKKSGKDVPKPLLIVIKKYKESMEKLRVAEEEYESAKKELELIEKEMSEIENAYKKGHVIIKGRINSNNRILFDGNLKRVLSNTQENVKIYVREIQGKESIVIEPNNAD